MAALTAAQRADIRFFLGWSARFFQFDSRLDQAMNGLNTELESQALVIAEVDVCKAIDVKLTDSHKRLKALKVGTIELPAMNEINMLRSEGREHVGRIASTLGVEVRHDVFSGTGPRAFASADGMVPGGYGGNYTPQG